MDNETTSNNRKTKPQRNLLPTNLNDEKSDANSVTCDLKYYNPRCLVDAIHNQEIEEENEFYKK